MTDIIRRETDEIIEETLLENDYDVEEETAEEGTTIDENFLFNNCHYSCFCSNN